MDQVARTQPAVARDQRAREDDVLELQRPDGSHGRRELERRVERGQPTHRNVGVHELLQHLRRGRQRVSLAHGALEEGLRLLTQRVRTSDMCGHLLDPDGVHWCEAGEDRPTFVV